MRSVREWHTSSHSPDGAKCVEVSEGLATKVRDSQNRELGHLTFDAAEWRAFLTDVKRDRL
ncbi:hypothetical protein HNR23_003923 [Nocardiopsis mwathae]|uniref:DUF397 domain-containing protein n=1 Tax=Nocardiopsis mwathae TaxID=1472723 RepID=A0A7W9YKJ0_9ACTN|nr:DUF397 domain-containing protein [Nocardiopsis mwathae]MBB6173863.1 hypothetical protein [Nocardiopsis mwathae]